MATVATVPGGVVRREFVDRFPYAVNFVETEALRRVIMILGCPERPLVCQGLQPSRDMCGGSPDDTRATLAS